MITIEDALNHIRPVCTEEQLAVFETIIKKNLSEKNHFYSYCYLSWYYGKPGTHRESPDYYSMVKMRYLSPYDKTVKSEIVELIPFPLLSLEPGVMIDTRSMMRHKPIHKYGFDKPCYEIQRNDGVKLTVKCRYTWLRKEYELNEVWDLEETKRKIYQQIYFIGKWKP